MDALTINTQCYHCGTEVADDAYQFDDKQFCCIGCQSVYQVLSSSGMCGYYTYNDNPGQAQNLPEKQLDYLNEPAIINRLIDYSDEKITSITFYVPSIHCSSCIWLLEHLHKFNPAIVHTRVDFLKKQVSVTFRHQEISLKKVVELMLSVGYEPLISLQDVVKEKQQSVNRDLIKKIAVAGFCMGNVMMLSFPEYLGLSSFEQQFRSLFGWLNLAFAIPVTFYCGRDFFVSGWAGLRQKRVNLDAPMALIIAVLFLRSAFEIITGSGAGFTDTLAGLVFLLLCGRWVRQRAYYHLSFKRDYRSYFPVAVTVIKTDAERSVPIEELTIGDRILIRNNEIIPADAILMKGDAFVDFSFVTGESDPVKKVLGEIVYAGGRQTGQAIELEVIKPVSQSYLTSLWNNEAFAKEDVTTLTNFNDHIAKYFSLVALLIAFTAAGYWFSVAESHKAWDAFTAVLIVACPCVLALSTPFTLSAVLSIFDRHQFHLKSTDIVERLARVDTFVFDKTGTITSPDDTQISFTGKLTEKEKVLVASLSRNSGHPLSREIIKWIRPGKYFEAGSFEEIPGKGISGIVEGHLVRSGSHSFINTPGRVSDDPSSVHIEIDGIYKGFFRISQSWRPGLKTLFTELSGNSNLHLLSGDKETEREELASFFPYPHQMHFRQSPQEKLEYISALQSAGQKVMMLGDGLNDAGALKQSDIGIAVTDNINNFSPACDAVLSGRSSNLLPSFIRQAKQAMRTVKISFAIAASYNLIGVFFAVQALISPLLAAVLMPMSTITIITFTTVSTRYFANKNKLL